MRRRFLVLALVLSASVVAYAQTRPLGLPQFPEPPEANGADPMLYPNGVLFNTSLLCSQRSTSFGWTCMASRDEVDAGVSSVRAELVAGLVSQDSARAAAVAALNARVDAVADAGTSGTSALGARVTSLEARVPPAPVLYRKCFPQAVSGLSIPILGVQTAPIVVTATGALVGHPCEVGSTSFDPVGAEGVCRVITSGVATLRWKANAGPLSSVLAIPNGTYQVCPTFSL